MIKCEWYKIYIYWLWRKEFTNLTKLFLTSNLIFFDTVLTSTLSLSLVFLWLIRKGMQNRWSRCMLKFCDIKKQKNFIMINLMGQSKTTSYSISLQMINKNAITFYQKNMSKHPPSPMNWPSFTYMHSRLPTSIMNYLFVRVQSVVNKTLRTE